MVQNDNRSKLHRPRNVLFLKFASLCKDLDHLKLALKHAVGLFILGFSFELHLENSFYQLPRKRCLCRYLAHDQNDLGPTLCIFLVDYSQK